MPPMSKAAADGDEIGDSVIKGTGKVEATILNALNETSPAAAAPRARETGNGEQVVENKSPKQDAEQANATVIDGHGSAGHERTTNQNRSDEEMTNSNANKRPISSDTSNDRAPQTGPGESLDLGSCVISVAFYRDGKFPPDDCEWVETIYNVTRTPVTPLKREWSFYHASAPASGGVIPEDEWPCRPPLEKLQRTEDEDGVGKTAGSTKTAPRIPRRRRTTRGDPVRTAPDATRCSRIGDRYQATTLPKAGDISLEDESYGSDTVLWDPVAFQRAQALGADFGAFLGKKLRQNRSNTLALQALHEVGYDTSKATAKFVQLMNKDRERFRMDPHTELNGDEIEVLYKWFCYQPVKDFYKISKALGHDMDVVQFHYYRWKGQYPGQYKKAKAARGKEQENNWCAICDDGGELLVCDLCKKGYHLGCLTPPLAKVPEGDWYCDRCIVRSPARVRSLNRVLGSPKRKTHLFLQENEAFVSARAAPAAAATKSPSRRNVTSSWSTDTSKPNTLKLANPEPEPNVRGTQHHQTDVRLGELYAVSIPKSSSGSLMIAIGFDSRGRNIVFLGYRRADDGSMGYAEKNCLFRAIGDVVYKINNNVIEGMTWEEAVPVLDSAVASPQNDVVHFVMRRSAMFSNTLENQSSNISNSKENRPIPAAGRMSEVVSLSSNQYPQRQQQQHVPSSTQPATAKHSALTAGGYQNLQQGHNTLQMSFQGLVGKNAVAPAAEAHGHGESARAQSRLAQHVPAVRLDVAAPAKEKPEQSYVRPPTNAAAPSAAPRAPTNSNRALGFQQYIARVPVTSEGLLISIATKNGRPIFTGYRNFRNGTKSPAMMMQPPPFRNTGDQIVAVDNVECENLTFDQVVVLLKDNHGKKFRNLRMRAPQKK